MGWYIGRPSEAWLGGFAGRLCWEALLGGLAGGLSGRLLRLPGRLLGLSWGSLGGHLGPPGDPNRLPTRFWGFAGFLKKEVIIICK